MAGEGDELLSTQDRVLLPRLPRRGWGWGGAGRRPPTLSKGEAVFSLPHYPKATQLRQISGAVARSGARASKGGETGAKGTAGSHHPPSQVLPKMLLPSSPVAPSQLVPAEIPLVQLPWPAEISILPLPKALSTYASVKMPFWTALNIHTSRTSPAVPPAHPLADPRAPGGSWPLVECSLIGA